jgi:hypothetical protein
MFASSIGPLRWLSRIVLVIMAVFVLLFALQQGVVRILCRAVPRPMPSRLAPVLTSPWRSRLFGIPEQTLDRSGVMPGIRVLEIGPGPGVYTVPLARRVAFLSPLSHEFRDRRSKASETTNNFQRELSLSLAVPSPEVARKLHTGLQRPRLRGPA